MDIAWGGWLIGIEISVGVDPYHSNILVNVRNSPHWAERDAVITSENEGKFAFLQDGGNDSWQFFRDAYDWVKVF